MTMGIFDKVFGKKDEKLNEAEGFAGIALCAVAADGRITEEEAISLGMNLMNRKLYQGYSDKEMRAVFNKLVSIVNDEGVNALIDKSAAVISQELKPTAFAVTTELLLADGIMEEKEKKFLERVQKALGLPDETAMKIAEVIAIKNKG